MIWLARFVQIASGAIVFFGASERSVIGAMIGWTLCTIVPLLYALVDEKDLQ